MAEVIEGFEFPKPGQNLRSNAKYPWNEWMNGQTWRITQGVDFDCKTQSIKFLIYKRAEVLGITVKVHTESPTSVIFRAVHQETP